MALLSREQWEVGELAVHLAVRPPQVKSHLRVLAQYGLAQQVDNGMWKGLRLSVAELTSLAHLLGVADAGRRQRQLHLLERKAFAVGVSRRDRIPLCPTR